jgi:hypothetical protein
MRAVFPLLFVMLLPAILVSETSPWILLLFRILCHDDVGKPVAFANITSKLYQLRIGT